MQNPGSFADESGFCASPSGVAPGQVGLCVEAFIAAARIGPGGVGHGDARGFSGSDPVLTARATSMIVVDPVSGTIRATHSAAVSYMGYGPASAGIAGTVNASITGQTTNNDGSVSFTLTVRALNGPRHVTPSAIPMFDLDHPIDYVVRFRVHRDGSVLMEARSDDYPSYGVYAYQSGSLVPTVLLEKRETTIERLASPMDSRNRAMASPPTAVVPTCSSSAACGE